MLGNLIVSRYQKLITSTMLVGAIHELPLLRSHIKDCMRSPIPIFLVAEYLAVESKSEVR